MDTTGSVSYVDSDDKQKLVGKSHRRHGNGEGWFYRILGSFWTGVIGPAICGLLLLVVSLLFWVVHTVRCILQCALSFFRGCWRWLREWLSSPRLKVYPIVTSDTHNAANQVLQKVKNLGLRLTPEEAADCQVVLLFCVVLSRVGSDVEEAMMRIPEAARGKPVFLVIMHHTWNVDHQTDGALWAHMYQHVVFHTDVLFHQTRSGLLQCERNDKAMKELRKNCQNYI